MELLIQIKEVSKTAQSYPELVKLFVELGITSYTVDVQTGIVCYRSGIGEVTISQPQKVAVAEISTVFNEQLVKNAITNNQQGKSDFPGFMKEIAAAGVYFYEAVLIGDAKRVIYIGIGGHYAEPIPV